MRVTGTRKLNKSGKVYGKRKLNGTVATTTYVKNAIKGDQEKKYRSYTGSSGIGNTWTDMHNINQIAEGTGVSDRVGKVVHPYAIVGNYVAVANAALSTTTMRIVILQDLQQVTGATIVAKSNVFRADLVYSIRNYTYMSRYKILWDRTFAFSNTGNLVHKGKFNIKLTRPQTWSTNLNTSISKNGIYMIGISSTGVSLPLFDADFSVLYRE